mgnify:FL=1
MYTRQILEQPGSFVKNKRPVFGTFAGHPKRLDIRGVYKPYGTVPIPTLITNLRIKSRLSFYFMIGEYAGSISFVDAKVFGFAEVVFWNTATKQKFVYRSVMGPRKRFVPHGLETASTSSYKKSRYIRISWDRRHDKLSVIFNLHGDSVRPSANAALVAAFSDKSFAELTTVLPAPTLRRCSGIYNAAMSLHGAITLIPGHGAIRTMSDADGLAFMNMHRTYMKFRSHGETITAMGTVAGKKVSFRIESGSQNSVNRELYNANVLFCDGTVTPLPPVLMTHSYGISNKWIIQDTENMVDLTFTPVSENLSKISIFILRTVYHTIFGTLEGTIMTAAGEKISFRSMAAIAENYLIRL